MEKTLQTNELENAQPLIIQYFRAIDSLVNGISPKDNSFYIELYSSGMYQPTVDILRTQTEESETQILKKDEIGLRGNKDKIDYSAKCDQEGNYMEYPDNLSKKELGYIKGLVHRFNELSHTLDARVVINGETSWVSDGNAWISATKSSPAEKPQFTGGTRLLPKK